MLKKAEMQAVIDVYLKDVTKGGLGGPFVVARFASEILHSQDRLLTHQNFFVRFIPDKAHKWLVGYLMRGCFKTWGEAACVDCYNRQKEKKPLEIIAKEHRTMIRLMAWYWVKKKGDQNADT